MDDFEIRERRQTPRRNEKSLSARKAEVNRANESEIQKLRKKISQRMRAAKCAARKEHVSKQKTAGKFAKKTSKLIDEPKRSSPQQKRDSCKMKNLKGARKSGLQQNNRVRSSRPVKEMEWKDISKIFPVPRGYRVRERHGRCRSCIDPLKAINHASDGDNSDSECNEFVIYCSVRDGIASAEWTDVFIVDLLNMRPTKSEIYWNISRSNIDSSIKDMLVAIV